MRYCENCGEPLDEGIIFCPNCGAKIEVEDTLRHQETEYEVDEPSSKKNKILIGVIAALVVVLIAGGAFFILNKPSEKVASTQETTQNVENNEDTNETNNTTDEGLEGDGTGTTTEDTGMRNTDYLLSNSSSAYLSDSDISGLSKSQLRLARNEIYAKHGYIFKDQSLADYFKSKSWYSPRSGDQDVISKQFNNYEKENVLFLKKKEAAM